MKKITLLIAMFCLNSAIIFGQSSSNSCAEAAVADPITGPGLFTVTAINGSEIPSPICAENGTSSQLEYGEWYRYTPSISTYTTISSDSNTLTQNAGKDTRVHIYSGSCGSLSCIDGDDDSGGGFTSVVGFNATAGETYYIAWDDRWDESGFDFLVSEGSAPPPPPITFTSQSISAPGSDRAAVDMNNDYLDDIVAVTTTNININYQLPGGGFNNVDYPTTNSINSPSWSLAAGDIDGNGYNDLLYAGGGGVTFMMANSNGTNYTPLIGPEDIFSQRSHFIDIDNDGNLDAFVCHDVEPNVYYINDITSDTG
ncbi:MAG: VCBS repeat-containing protein, partial [Flavobacteriaceae bacterium]|nr:VCBS repeat-containing protein [Flavobacteriaceae bacterium]